MPMRWHGREISPGIGEPLVPGGPASYLLWPCLSNLLEFFFTPFLFLKRIKETLAPSIPYKKCYWNRLPSFMQKNAYYPTVANLYIYRFTQNLLIPWNTSWGSSHLTEMFWQSLGCKYSSDVDGTYLVPGFPCPRKAPLLPCSQTFSPGLGLLSTQALSSCFPVCSKAPLLVPALKEQGEFFFPQVYFEYKARPEIFLKVFSANDHPDNKISTD